MSEKLTKKQKKSSEFRTKKRKLDDSIPDVPEEDTAENSAKDTAEAKTTKATKKTKTESATGEVKTETTATDGKKKRRRGKGSKEEEPKEGEAKEGEAAKEGETPKAAPKNSKFIVFVGTLRLSSIFVLLVCCSRALESDAKSLFLTLAFIYFFIVGNLPFNITKEQLEKHFESCGMCHRKFFNYRLCWSSLLHGDSL